MITSLFNLKFKDVDNTENIQTSSTILSEQLCIGIRNEYIYVCVCIHIHIHMDAIRMNMRSHDVKGEQTWKYGIVWKEGKMHEI